MPATIPAGIARTCDSVLMDVAGLCVAASTVQYFHRFGYLFWAPPRSEGA